MAGEIFMRELARSLPLPAVEMWWCRGEPLWRDQGYPFFRAPIFAIVSGFSRSTSRRAAASGAF